MRLHSSLQKRMAGVLLIASLLQGKAYAQAAADSIALTLPQAESIFLQQNLLLLAQKFQVEASRAQIIQARLWSNPYVSFSQGGYNPQSKKWFSFDPQNGETAVSVEQLIQLAGKIKKQTRMAQSGFEQSEAGFQDLLRNLRYSLHADFFTLYYQQRSARVYQEEISSLQKAVSAFEQQAGKGYISQTEYVRIKAQLYSLRSEYADLVNDMNDQQSEIRQLLNEKPGHFIVPVADSSAAYNIKPLNYALQTLLDSAYQNRSDLKMARIGVTLSQQNLSYQKALAVPDLTLGLGYDKNGSYVHNANLLNLGFSVPLFNRNQGNIKTAQSLVGYNKTLLENSQKTMEEQIYRGLQRAMDADSLVRSVDPGFSNRFGQLSVAVLDNYLKRNIGLLDFLNFYDSYKQNVLQQNNMLLNKVLSLENLNYLTGTNFYHE